MLRNKASFLRDFISPLPRSDRVISPTHCAFPPNCRVVCRDFFATKKNLAQFAAYPVLLRNRYEMPFVL